MASTVTVPSADQNAVGSLPAYAERAAIRTRTDPIQPANASQRGRILVAAPSEPAAPRKNAAGTNAGAAPTTPLVSKSPRTSTGSAVLLTAIASTARFSPRLTYTITTTATPAPNVVVAR